VISVDRIVSGLGYFLLPSPTVFSFCTGMVLMMGMRASGCRVFMAQGYWVSQYRSNSLENVLFSATSR
jgi:hypothetical protein